MAKDSLAFGFGKPKALPGQPGYNQNPSTKLEQDAKVMESRLARLRMDLLQEQQKREQEKPLKHAGNRWRSARQDRGSISTYAKDVHERIQQKDTHKPTAKSQSRKLGSSSTPSSHITTTIGTNSPGSPSSSNLLTCLQWQNQHVLDWLASLGLEELQSCFEFHQVTGKELMQLTTQDLSRMGVANQGVCALILHQVDKMRTRVAKDSDKHDKRSVPAPAEVNDPKIHDAEPKMGSPGPSSGQIHWTQAKPLCENPITCQQDDVVVNLADGEFNEDASHESFLKALLEWREGGKESTQADKADGSMWVNPMVSSRSDNQSNHSSCGNNSEGGGGGALLVGTYDEAKEQLEFQRAVDAWRRGTSATTSDDAHAVQPIKPDSKETSSANSTKKSCWHCYQVCLSEMMVHDGQNHKDFCSSHCQEHYQSEMARFYKDTADPKAKQQQEAN